MSEVGLLDMTRAAQAERARAVLKAEGREFVGYDPQDFGGSTRGGVDLSRLPGGAANAEALKKVLDHEARKSLKKKKVW